MKTQLKFVQTTFGANNEPLDEVGLLAVDALRYSRVYITKQKPSEDDIEKMIAQFKQENSDFRFDYVEVMTAVA